MSNLIRFQHHLKGQDTEARNLNELISNEELNLLPRLEKIITFERYTLLNASSLFRCFILWSIIQYYYLHMIISKQFYFEHEMPPDRFSQEEYRIKMLPYALASECVTKHALK